jgi:hypothetical protein
MNMKKQLLMLVILLTLVFSTLNLTYVKLVPTASATYVEGPITQDTVWTLVQSPFVVAKDVMVYPNATLTIEPGVEVRFGGAFSLIVSGKLYADGTGQAISFTSNKETPSIEDWNAIKFNGTSTSTMINCSITYATNGVSVENSNVLIEKSTISLSGNGVNVTDGHATVQNSVITQNLENGIAIAGPGQVTLENNTLTANGNGILLTGNDTANVNIRWNKISANNANGILLTGNDTSNVSINWNEISANNDSGIQVNAATLTGLVVFDNVVSSNGKGFYISTLTSTSISNETVSYNGVGMLYGAGSHNATYNDIYDNGIGMDVLQNATVNAEHNYWGDPTGPYHVSLNPNGKGNRVGGNGVNLNFIFFLTKPAENANVPPTANLLTDKVTVQPNESLMFFGTNSYDPDGTVDEYLYNFGDGTSSGWTTLSIFTHDYSNIGTYSVNLTAMDDYGATSTPAKTVIYVQNLPLLYVNLVLNSSAVPEAGKVSATIHVTDATGTAVEGATVTLFAIGGGEFTPTSQPTDANGYFVTTFTAPNVTELTNVRIVASASKSGYADNSDYGYVQVLPYLSLQATVSPSPIKSEGNATITVYVKSGETPIANANVTASSNVGSLNHQTGTTDPNGILQLNFTAPQTTTLLNATITAVATKNNYLAGTGQAKFPIEPKIPVVEIITSSNSTLSDAKLTVTVHVEYDNSPLASSNITIAADNGNLSATAGSANKYGNATFTLTAPLVNKQTNITLTAQATKTGYAETQSQLKIPVQPRTFTLQITTPETTSGESATIDVHITCTEDKTVVPDATVTMSSAAGNFNQTTVTTDQSGTSTFTFNAPRTRSQLSIPITANVTKNGYVEGTSQTTITVLPETVSQSGGLSLMTILLILIPILIVIILVILVKLKILSISAEEEQE